MKSIVRPALICFGIMTILCGVLYTGAVTGVGQLIFPYEANGSIINVTKADGSKTIYGSGLIAQVFTKPEYLIGRPMGTSNLSPIGAKQNMLVKERINWWKSINPETKGEIPMDLLTASGSGVDPHISPEAAKYQISRIAKKRNISEAEVKKIIDQYTTTPLLGIWGEPAVNVLKVNLALDGLK